MNKRICIIDCGSDKTDEIYRIAKNPNHRIDIWYLYYPSIKFKLDIDTESIRDICLIQKQDNKVFISAFDAKFLEKYDYLVFSGGGIIETIQNEIISFFSFLRETKKPTLGICFGHQLIGLVFGANVYKLNKVVKGQQKINFIKSNELIDKSINQAKFVQNHLEAISVAKDFDLLASSESTENEMMSHKTKAIYGVQFHPEVSGDIGALLIKNFLNLQSK